LGVEGPKEKVKETRLDRAKRRAIEEELDLFKQATKKALESPPMNPSPDPELLGPND
jgi:hypothetical protein